MREGHYILHICLRAQVVNRFSSEPRESSPDPINSIVRFVTCNGWQEGGRFPVPSPIPFPAPSPFLFSFPPLLLFQKSFSVSTNSLPLLFPLFFFIPFSIPPLQLHCPLLQLSCLPLTFLFSFLSFQFPFLFSFPSSSSYFGNGNWTFQIQVFHSNKDLLGSA